jgi:hypothetical protein
VGLGLTWTKQPFPRIGSAPWQRPDWTASTLSLHTSEGPGTHYLNLATTLSFDIWAILAWTEPKSACQFQ